MIGIEIILSKYYQKSVRINNSNVHFYYIKNFSERLNKAYISLLFNELKTLLVASWGEFNELFLNDHIISSKYIIIAVIENNIIGFISINERNIYKRHYYYFEFLVVDPKYQSLNISNQLIRLFFQKIFIEHILKFNIYLHLITISPNPKILGMISRRAIWMYPDPKKFNGYKLYPADEHTYRIAQKIIDDSYDPDRKLDKEGLVLHDSYKDTPDLIYNYEKVPWDHDQNINILCDRYLDYKKGYGKEFVIIAKFKLLSLKLFI